MRMLWLILFFCSGILHAQRKGNGDAERLALQYYEQGEYEKAIAQVEPLYYSNPAAWFTVYFKSLLAIKDYSRAEKIVRKQIKQSHAPAPFYVQLGKVYRLQNDAKKEKDSYEKAVKELKPIQPYINNLASVFMEERLYDYAIQVYNKAKRENPDYPYFYERADVYKAKHDYAAMINEYLDALEFRESELQSVQIQLQNSLGYDDEEGGMKNPLLRQELQKRIQKDPGNVVLSEFLIFILKQQKEFDAAFVQSRALDKRLKEDGRRIFELAKNCEANENWEVAIRCYEYLLEKGPSSNFYDVASIEILNVEYLSLTRRANPDRSAVLALEQKLTVAYEKFKQTGLRGSLVKSLATLKAYYLGKHQEAIALIQAFIGNPGVDAAIKAEYKIMLGDIYLLTGEIWEASLLYSQVEKAYKFETIGHEAKFRNAKLSFYAGEFAWAKTQADVLKGSVEKLIANDALDLSLVITDAIGVDTNDVPLKMFASAELLMMQNRHEDAIARMDSINLLFSSHTLGDDINYKKAKVFRRHGRLKEAEAMYKDILEYYPDGLYGDDAQFNLAELYEYDMKDKEKAGEAYKNVFTKYPGSIYKVEARKRYRTLRGDTLNN